jgi:hypothetical protein
MAFTLIAILIAVGLFGGMLVMQVVGRRLGEHERRLDPDTKHDGTTAAEAAVVGLLGLLVAFTFSGAGSRFDSRRNLIVDETNAIGKAYLRVDLLPADRQPQVRDLFRKYVDTRLAIYEGVPDMDAVTAASARADGLQREIWSASVEAARETGSTPAFTLLLPAVNEMIDITTTRTAAARMHPPAAVYVILAVLALVAAVFAGYGMAGRRVVSWIHRFGFALVITVAVYLIIDFEFPRLGLIRVDAHDQLLVDLRRSMN